MDSAQTHNAKVQSVLFVIGSSSVCGHSTRAITQQSWPAALLAAIDWRKRRFNNFPLTLRWAWRLLKPKNIKDSEECVFVETVKWRSSRHRLEATGNCKKTHWRWHGTHHSVTSESRNIWLNYWCRKILLRANFRRNSISSWNIISCSSFENRL